MPEEPIDDRPVESEIQAVDQEVAAVEKKIIEIPEGFRVVTIIVDKGEVVEKIYQSPNGQKISIHY